MATLNILKMKFAMGATKSSPPLEISPSSVTVIVGPNNSGKSLTLREIDEWCWTPGRPGKIVSDIEFGLPATWPEVLELLEPFHSLPPENQVEATDHYWLGHHSFRAGARHFQQSLADLRQAVTNGSRRVLEDVLLKLYSIRLDGRTRFALVDAKPAGDLNLPPQNHLWALFQNDEARGRVRRATAEAFQLHFTIDPTAMTQYRVRMSARHPSGPEEERSLDRQGLEFHRTAKLITEFGDGVQTFTGLVSAVLSLPHKVMLIDEPEAFLHPPLARRLGRDLAANAGEGCLIAATHSADFLMGCLEAVPDTTIVRLTYESEVGTARALPGSVLEDLMLDPLLRSTGALEGLFHRAVVVVEGDSDRAFYGEVNRRLQSVGHGVDDALFVPTHGWQSIARIIGPLRRLGIPAAAILDLDSIKSAGPWRAFYDGMALTGVQRTRLEARRAASANALITSKRTGLPLSSREASDLASLLRYLAGYGIFVVPVGSLENWLSTLGVGTTKDGWIARMFGAMGSRPQAASYVRPAAGDVWSFLDVVGRWAARSTRRGIPV